MSLVIDVKVVPQSGRQKFALDKAGTLKIFLKSVPEGGRANAELLALLSKKLRVPVGEIAIMLGAASRKKRLKIGVGLTFEELLDRLGVERQQTLA